MSEANADVHAGRGPFPPPTSVSPAAQKALRAPSSLHASYPALDDLEGWRTQISTFNDAILNFLKARMSDHGIRVEAATLGGVPVFRAEPDGHDPSDRRVVMDIHGGALIYLGGAAVGLLAGHVARQTQAKVVSIDYRVPPDHPFPAALDDCLAVYTALLKEHRPEDIIVSGSSAGGNLAAAALLKARDEGLTLPAGLVLLSPEVDLTEAGDTFTTLLGVDPMLSGSLMPINRLYAGSTPLDHPYVSPLFGDFSRGFPPTFLQSGTRDLLLSNTVRMHRALRQAGIPAELHVFEAMPHGGFGGAPEDEDLAVEIRHFLKRHWPEHIAARTP